MFLLVLLAFAACAQGYTDYSFSVHAVVSADDNAHVIEKTVLNLDTEDERQEFEYYLGQGQTTLADWQKFSRSIKYHFTGSITNLSIIAAREFGIRYTAASVAIEYDLAGLFNASKTSNRVTKYSLDARKLLFSSSRTGEIALGTENSFLLELPEDAVSVRVVPEPGVQRVEHNKLRWTGPIIGHWDVSFEREKSLSQEVNEFFKETYESASDSYLWVLGLAFLLFVAFKLLKLRKQ